MALINDTFGEDSDDFISNAADDNPSPADLTIRDERASQIRKAPSLISNEKHRRLLELLYLDSTNYPSLIEVAATLGIKPTSIGQDHKRAKETLKEKLRIIAPDIHPSTDTTRQES